MVGGTKKSYQKPIERNMFLSLSLMALKLDLAAIFRPLDIGFHDLEYSLAKKKFVDELVERQIA